MHVHDNLLHITFFVKTACQMNSLNVFCQLYSVSPFVPSAHVQQVVWLAMQLNTKCSTKMQRQVGLGGPSFQRDNKEECIGGGSRGGSGRRQELPVGLSNIPTALRAGTDKGSLPTRPSAQQQEQTPLQRDIKNTMKYITLSSWALFFFNLGCFVVGP